MFPKSVICLFYQCITLSDTLALYNLTDKTVYSSLLLLFNQSTLQGQLRYERQGFKCINKKKKKKVNFPFIKPHKTIFNEEYFLCTTFFLRKKVVVFLILHLGLCYSFPYPVLTTFKVTRELIHKLKGVYTYII